MSVLQQFATQFYETTPAVLKFLLFGIVFIMEILLEFGNFVEAVLECVVSNILCGIFSVLEYLWYFLGIGGKLIVEIGRISVPYLAESGLPAIVSVVCSILRGIFSLLEYLWYFLWTGGKLIVEIGRISVPYLAESGLPAWKYFVLSLTESSSSILSGFATLGLTIKSVAIFIYGSIWWYYESVQEAIYSIDFIIRDICRYFCYAVYIFVTNYLLNHPNQVFLSVIVCFATCLLYKKVFQHLCSESLTLPFVRWFNNLTVQEEVEAHFEDENRGEFSDDDEGLIDLTYDDFDEYSVSSENSDNTNSMDEENISEGEELSTDSESNTASESEASEINIELPQGTGTHDFRRSTTPSRVTKDMSADDLQRLIEEEKEKRTCVVCQDRTKSVLILPCRHMCVCVECGNLIARSVTSEGRKCPLCRTKIKTIMNVYI